MINPEEIRITDYTYDLPEYRIAKYPLNNRDSSKLLVYREGSISDDCFCNIDAYLGSGDLLMFNNTRVIRARLKFRRTTGAVIEIFCLEPLNPADYESSFSTTESTEWKCLIGNLKKWKEDILELKFNYHNKTCILKAEKGHELEKGWAVRFSWNIPSLSFAGLIEYIGHIPVPPYLNRDDEEIDKVRYQTVYSSHNGSVAAPTAGLHFSDELLARIEKKRIEKAEITLHVGAGTFIPVKSDTISEHSMHVEHFDVGIETIKQMAGRKIIAVGTTTLRTIESIYWLGVKISRDLVTCPEDMYMDQWFPYNGGSEISSEEALNNVVGFMEKHGISRLDSRTGIIIIPGYSMKIARGLITNYHMPRSTLLLLVAAFVGDKWRDIYDYALEKDFRFLSYGDSSILLP